MLIDLIVLLFLLFFIWRGALRGFLRSLIGPVAFILATAGAFFYYQNTKNIYIALGIGLVGPFLLTFFLAFILRSFGFLGPGKLQPSLLSRLLGVCITVVWGMAIILPIICVLDFVPGLGPYTKSSLLVSAVKPLTKIFLPQMTAGTADPAEPVDPNHSPFQTISQDPRMQAILNDPDIAQAIETKNYAALMSNPKILEIAQDPAFVQKLLSAYAESQKTNE